MLLMQRDKKNHVLYALLNMKNNKLSLNCTVIINFINNALRIGSNKNLVAHCVEAQHYTKGNKIDNFEIKIT